MSDRVGPVPKPTPRPRDVGMTPTHTVEVGGKTRNAIQAGPSELPPPGHERREELKRRDDDLQERLARIEAAMGLDNSAGPPVDISHFSISNEIASRFDMLKVTDAQPDYAYYWANFASQHGIDVSSHEVMGYEVVCGDMPEAKKCRDELGRRRIGDVILMRTPIDNYLELQQLDRWKRQQRQQNVEATLMAMGERYAGRGINVTRGLNPYQTQRAMQRAQAQQIARQQFNDLLRSGQVRGLQAGS